MLSRALTAAVTTLTPLTTLTTLTTLSAASTVAQRPDWGDQMGYGMGGIGMGWGIVWWFLITPLVSILVVGILLAIFGRRWRRGTQGEQGPGRAGTQAATDARSAEKTLAERFAQGDIDEVEYRARLEVLRANRETPPVAG